MNVEDLDEFDIFLDHYEKVNLKEFRKLAQTLYELDEKDLTEDVAQLFIGENGYSSSLDFLIDDIRRFKEMKIHKKLFTSANKEKFIILSASYLANGKSRANIEYLLYYLSV